MIKYDELYKIVESKLSSKRFNHTLRVVDRAIEYAKVYDLDLEKVKLTALAHDIAKELSQEELEKYYNSFDEIELINSNLRHAKVGAIICSDYGFSKDMIDAIKYHTTGRSNMIMLEKIIYLADATEESREIGKNYVDLVKSDIDKAILEICSLTLQYLLKENKIIHVDSINCYNYYNHLINNCNGFN